MFPKMQGSALKRMPRGWFDMTTRICSLPRVKVSAIVKAEREFNLKTQDSLLIISSV